MNSTMNQVAVSQYLVYVTRPELGLQKRLSAFQPAKRLFCTRNWTLRSRLFGFGNITRVVQWSTRQTDPRFGFRVSLSFMGGVGSGRVGSGRVGPEGVKTSRVGLGHDQRDTCYVAGRTTLPRKLFSTDPRVSVPWIRPVDATLQELTASCP